MDAQWEPPDSPSHPPKWRSKLLKFECERPVHRFRSGLPGPVCSIRTSCEFIHYPRERKRESKKRILDGSGEISPKIVTFVLTWHRLEGCQFIISPTPNLESRSSSNRTWRFIIWSARSEQIFIIPCQETLLYSPARGATLGVKMNYFSTSAKVSFVQLVNNNPFSALFLI